MKLLRTSHFERNYAKASQQVQRAIDKQSLPLLQNLHHPSLRAKKYDESRGLWQARVTKDWRFYFLIRSDGYPIVNIITGPAFGAALSAPRPGRTTGIQPGDRIMASVFASHVIDVDHGSGVQ
jgi:mRNA interferase RelE/StbE